MRAARPSRKAGGAVGGASTFVPLLHQTWEVRIRRYLCMFPNAGVVLSGRQLGQLAVDNGRQLAVSPAYRGQQKGGGCRRRASAKHDSPAFSWPPHLIVDNRRVLIRGGRHASAKHDSPAFSWPPRPPYRGQQKGGGRLQSTSNTRRVSTAGSELIYSHHERPPPAPAGGTGGGAED